MQYLCNIAAAAAASGHIIIIVGYWWSVGRPDDAVRAGPRLLRHLFSHYFTDFARRISSQRFQLFHRSYQKDFFPTVFQYFTEVQKYGLKSG